MKCIGVRYKGEGPALYQITTDGIIAAEGVHTSRVLTLQQHSKNEGKCFACSERGGIRELHFDSSKGKMIETPEDIAFSLQSLVQL
jgi:predicted alternative tryptophan synthase beta-subunit